MKEIKYAKVIIYFWSGQIMEVSNVCDMRAVWRKVSKICKESARWSNEYLHTFGKRAEGVKMVELKYSDGRETYWKNHHRNGSRSRAIDCTPFNVKVGAVK